MTNKRKIKRARRAQNTSVLRKRRVKYKVKKYAHIMRPYMNNKVLMCNALSNYVFCSSKAQIRKMQRLFEAYTDLERSWKEFECRVKNQLKAE